MKRIGTKIVILLLTITILVNGLILPKKAQAILGVGDIVFDPTLVVTTISNWALQIARWVKEDLMKSLRDAMAKRIMDYIVDETVRWIQGGGKPQFISDWDGFLKNAGNIAFDEVVKDVGLAWICSPFKLQVQLSLQRPPTFSQRLDCTLDKVVANIENFYNDFNNGGWIAYNELWQPQNNYYGQMLMIHDEALMRAAAARQAAQNEGIASGGFLSSKRCKGGGTPTGGLDAIVNSGGSINGYTQDSKGNWCPASQIEIVTPGSTVGAAVANAITSDSQWAANIQSWISALVNALINRLVSEGLSSMLGSGSSGTVSIGGSGGIIPSTNQRVLVTSAAPYEGGIVSGDGVYNKGSRVTVTATSNGGYRFSSWSGDVAGTNPTAQVVMDRDKFAIANFIEIGGGSGGGGAPETSEIIYWNTAPNLYRTSQTFLSPNQTKNFIFRAPENTSYFTIEFISMGVIVEDGSLRIPLKPDGTYYRLNPLIAAEPIRDANGYLFTGLRDPSGGGLINFNVSAGGTGLFASGETIYPGDFVFTINGTPIATSSFAYLRSEIQYKTNATLLPWGVNPQTPDFGQILFQSGETKNYILRVPQNSSSFSFEANGSLMPLSMSYEIRIPLKPDGSHYKLKPGISLAEDSNGTIWRAQVSANQNMPSFRTRDIIQGIIYAGDFTVKITAGTGATGQTGYLQMTTELIP